jgi:hypothetical protein
MRIALAMVMIFHGMAHLAGFAGAWHIAPQGYPYKTTVFRGHVDLGDAGIRVVGALWLTMALAFVAAALGALLAVGWWPQFALVLAMASLTLSLAELPEARVGVAINVGILAALAAGRALGQF